ncbi:MAG: hypothetical protein R6U63_13035 [Longimicrobiales bacterium]
MSDAFESVARVLRPDPELEVHTEDHGTPEAVVHALYAALSGSGEPESPRDWDRLRSLLLPDARFLMTRWPDADGKPREDLRAWDVDGFITDARSSYGDQGFWERELWGRTERFGNIAHRISAYESVVGSEDADPVGRGVNSFQLVRFDRLWWIASVIWDVETPSHPLPEG